MIDVFICEPDEREIKLLSDECTAFYLNHNYEGEIYECVSAKNLIVQIENNQREYSVLFFVDCTELPELLVDTSFMELNNSSYLILMAEKMESVLNAISPLIRPSGYMLLPPEKLKTTELLSEIIRNHNKTEGKKQTYAFKIGSQVFRVELEKINYFAATNKKMVLRTVNQEYEFYDSFKNIEEKLPNSFVRSHKSFLVNMNNVARVDYKNMTIFFKDGTETYISRGYREKIEEYLDKRR